LQHSWADLRDFFHRAVSPQIKRIAADGRHLKGAVVAGRQVAVAIHEY